jgi:hypothetical protein
MEFGLQLLSLLKPGQMMTPDKGFLSRSHVPGGNPDNEAGGLR